MRWLCYIGTAVTVLGGFSGVTFAQGKVVDPGAANPVPPTSSQPGANPVLPPPPSPPGSGDAVGQTVPAQPGADPNAKPNSDSAPLPATGGPGMAAPQGSPTAPPYPYPYPPYYAPYPPYPPNQQGASYPPPWAWAPRPAPVTSWYGWQTLIGVVAGDALTLLGGSFNNAPMLYIGIGAHVFTGPIVHWAHGNAGKGFISLGLNLGIPTVGALSYVVLGYYGIILAGIGYLAAPTLDMALLSTETVEGPATAPKGARVLLPSSLGIMPMIDGNRRGLTLMGRF